MGLTGGERAALWRKRQREDPEKHRTYKEKERCRNKKRKEDGEFKSVREMSDREQRKTRRNWKNSQRKKRARDNMIKKHIEQTLSPPTSPSEEIGYNMPNQQSNKKAMGRKRVKKDRAKAYRELFALRVKLTKQRRLSEKFRKRAYRLEKDKHAITKEVRNKLHSTELRKALTLHVIMTRNIKSQYNACKTFKDKKLLRTTIWKNTLLKKYRLGKYATQVLGVNRPKCNAYQKSKPSFLKLMVHDYFERDDNSRVKAGKKSTITRQGEKRQIRLLNDSVKNIHCKFLSEIRSKISYSLFCKLKPFWVIKPIEKDRETCLCKIHENLQYKVNRLHHEKVINSKDIDTLIKEMTCDVKSKVCMYRECDRCRGRNIQFKYSDGRQVFWNVWRNTKIDKVKKNGKGECDIKKVSVTMREKEYGTIETLTVEVMKDLERACRHIYNIRHQYSVLKSLRENLNDNSAIIHMDFSENYNCKYEKEIQSMHFGASQRQISIHTGVVYLKDKKVSFSTFSDCLQHNPPAIWAHLKPVLRHIQSISKVDTIHFISDGPTTQYRSKTNFYMLSTKIFDFGFSKATWNFLEASHGKGAPDGIGAVVKRQADNLVNVSQKDIMKSSDLIHGLTMLGTSIQLFEIQPEEVSQIERTLKNDVKAVPQTMKIHQVVVQKKSQILSRVLSCFCSEETFTCECYSPVSTSFDDGRDVNTPTTTHSEDGLVPVTTPTPARSESGLIPASAPSTGPSDDGHTPMHHGNIVPHAMTPTTTSSDGRPTAAISPKAVRGEDERMVPTPMHTDDRTPVLQGVDNIDESLLGRHCVVEYDRLPYPGIIVDVDENEAEVNVMHRIGVNKFFWPSLMEDRLWYSRDKIVTLLEKPPVPVTARNFKLPQHVWEAIVLQLKLDEFGK